MDVSASRRHIHYTPARIKFFRRFYRKMNKISQKPSARVSLNLAGQGDGIEKIYIYIKFNHKSPRDTGRIHSSQTSRLDVISKMYIGLPRNSALIGKGWGPSIFSFKFNPLMLFLYSPGIKPLI